MKKLTLKNIVWLIVLLIIGHQVYDYISDYVKLRNYEYGKQYNSIRKKNNIPLLTDAIQPFRMYADKDYGMIWINDDNETSQKNKLIHKIKVIEASKQNGWVSEKDVFLFYKNEFKDYRLNIKSKFVNENIEFESVLSEVQKKTIEKEINTERINKNLDRSQLDSLKLVWRIK